MNTTIIECPICRCMLERPVVVLPCGHSVCKKHTIGSYLEKKLAVTCPVCLVEHEVPERGGFVPNSLAESLVARHFDELDFGADYKAASSWLSELRQLVEDLERIRERPDVRVKKVIEKMRNRISGTMERVKSNEFESKRGASLLAELNVYEKSCAGFVKSRRYAFPNQTDNLIRPIKRDLDWWENEMNTFRRDVTRWRTIQRQAIEKYLQLKQEMQRVEKNLFNNRLAGFQWRQARFCREILDLPRL